MRTYRTAGCLLLALTAALAGCGGSGTTATTSGDAPGGPLVVYSDLPLDSAAALDMSSMELGEQLALDQAGHHAGGFRVTLDSNNDTNAAGTWSPGATAQAAAAASADRNAIAYIGDFDSGATATSLPSTNDAGILQISPWSPYVGFTDQNRVDDPGDPVRFYPSGHNTFARLVPSDAVQAQGTVAYMRALGVSRLYVLEDISDRFDADIAELIANDAPPSITVVGQQPFDTETNTAPQGYAALAATIAASRADAVVLGGRPGPGAEALWSELHLVLKHAKLFAPSTLATPAFLAGLDASSSATYVTSPILKLHQYPRAGRRVLAAYRRRFGLAPTPYALYGYDAMRMVLRAIGRARSGSRAAVRSAFFHLPEMRGALGDYRIYRDGDTSLDALDGYTVNATGQLVFRERIPAG